MGRRSGEAKNGHETEKTFRRLPKCVVPVHYNLTFQPESEEPILNGLMDVRVQVMCETSEIVINGLNISLSNVKYTCEGSKASQESKDVLINKEFETIQIGFLNPLEPGFGTLSFEFEAQITDNMKGLYRTEIENKKYNYITHFEPVNARRCFPCFDEPAFKATFDITIIVPKNVVAISNMPIKEETSHEKNENLKVCKYQTTPKMSTYLIAMVIGDFEHAEKINANGTLVRVFTPPGKKEQATYSLNLAANLLTYYTEYFGIPYPLPKCDLVAIREFPIGGMENYGLITFVDTRLLVDNKETAAINKQFTSLIVSHEVSHLWFGDLVTMVWWCDLWLKEGFAKFIEYMAVNHFYPEFDIYTQFVSRILFSALNTDSLKSSHPIEVPVTDPAQIDEIFDNISYQKGASIIKMMYNFIGDACFRKGMNAYLEKFKYANAETQDLWDALEAASDKPVGKFMNTFTKQMGFPIVTVQDVTVQEGGKCFTLKQEKFWADPKLNSPENAESNANYKWIIPITFCKASNPLEVCASELFDGLKSNITKIFVPKVSPSEWVKLNAGTIGFYRVKYSPKVLSQFTSAIKDKTMSPLDRLGLLDDLFASVKSGLSSTADILNLLDSFKSEDNYSSWLCIRGITESLSKLLLRTEWVDKFDAYCISLFKPVKERMGWVAKNCESHTDGLLRALVINRLISHGDKQTINEAEKLFDQHLKGDIKISADLRSAVYRSVLSKGNSQTLDVMLDLYRKSELSEEKCRFLQTLGSVNDQNLIKKVLDFSISSEVKLNDVDYVFMSLTHSKYGQDAVWKFFKDNIQLFQEKYPGGMLICGIVKIVTEEFVGEEFATDIETFLKDNPIRGTERTVQQVLEKIRINSLWLERDIDAIVNFLNK